MTTHTLTNGQSATVGADQWDSDSLAFNDQPSAQGAAPLVTFTGPNSLALISDSGNATISLTVGASLATGRLTLNAGNLTISERPGDTVTFGGYASIANNATLTATGFAGTGQYAIDGFMRIDPTSTVNMDYVSLDGTGTIRLTGADSLLRVGNVGAGETVQLNAGMLSLTSGMTFQGTIGDTNPTRTRIGATATVAVYNATAAVSETFDTTTGQLGLFDAQGNPLAALTFAGTGTLYAAPTTGLATNYMAITSHPSANSLPLTLTH